MRHKPTMHPPHFWDLLNPSDGNFRFPSLGNKEFTTAGEGGHEDDDLHTYYFAAAFDAIVESFAKKNLVSEEVLGSPGAHRTILTFSSPPP